MKVLEKGHDNQVKCPCCSSTLEFEAADVLRVKAGTDPDDGTDYFSYSIHCPVCKHSVNVSHITPAMRSKVDEVQRNRDLADHDL